MADDATPPTSIPTQRRTAPTGPRSTGLRMVPPPALAPVIHLTPRAARGPRSAAPVTSPVLVVLPDLTRDQSDDRSHTVVLPDADADADMTKATPLSIQDRIRLRALEASTDR